MPESYAASLGRISGKLLTENLLRNGSDLTFRNAPTDDDLLYLDVNNLRIGINTDAPLYDLQIDTDVKTTVLNVTGQARIDNILINAAGSFGSYTGPIIISTAIPNSVISMGKLKSDYLEIYNGRIDSIANSNIKLDPNGTGRVVAESNVQTYGNVTVQGTGTGNIVMGGNLQADGTITVGDNILDTVTVNTDFTQSIIPGTDITYDLGKSNKRWSELRSPVWQQIDTIRPTNAIVSDQLFINGVDNKISGLQSNEDVLLNPETGIVYIERLKFSSTYQLIETYQDQLFSPPDAFVQQYPTEPNGLSFNPDGTILYTYGQDSFDGKLKVKQWTLSTPYDITSHTTGLFTEVDLVALGGMINHTNPGNIFFKPDGTSFYVGGKYSSTQYAVMQYNLSTPWDVTTASYAGKTANTTNNNRAQHKVWLNSAGTKMIILSGSLTVYYFSFTLSSPWNITTGLSVLESSTTGSGDFQYPSAFFLDDDGSKLHATVYVGSNNNFIRTFDLATPYVLSSRSLTLEIPTSSSFPSNAFFYLYVTDLKYANGNYYTAGANSGIYQYAVEPVDGIITNLDNTALQFASTGIGYVKFVGTNALAIPAGDNASRPAVPELGDTRWNTEISYLECFDGNVYVIATGGGEEVTQGVMEDLGNVFSLILG
jgi:hypothetical protein